MEGFNNYRPSLFPRLAKIKAIAERAVSMTLLASHGDHFNRGAAPMLDDQLEFDFTRPVPGQVGGVPANPTEAV